MKLRQPLITVAALLAAGVSLAQSTPSGSSAAPSPDPQYATPSSSTAAMGERAVGGLSRCENLIGLEREQCLKNERAGTGGSAGYSAGAGGSQAPGSIGSGGSTMGAQTPAPSGTVR